jgi:hypothetical protein
VREDPDRDLGRHEGDDQDQRRREPTRIRRAVVRMVVHEPILTAAAPVFTLFTYETR